MLIIGGRQSEITESSFYELLFEFSFEQGHVIYEDFLRNLLMADINDNGPSEYNPAKLKNHIQITHAVNQVYELGKFMRNVTNFSSQDFTKIDEDIKTVIDERNKICYELIEEEIYRSLDSWIYDEREGFEDLWYIVKLATSYKSVSDFVDLCREISAKHEAGKKLTASLSKEG